MLEAFKTRHEGRIFRSVKTCLKGVKTCLKGLKKCRKVLENKTCCVVKSCCVVSKDLKCRQVLENKTRRAPHAGAPEIPGEARGCAGQIHGPRPVPSPTRTRYKDILAVRSENLRSRTGFVACVCVNDCTYQIFGPRPVPSPTRTGVPH